MDDFSVHQRNAKEPNGKISKPKFLGVDRVVKDIKEMPRWFKYMMVSAVVIILFFEFFNVSGGNRFEPIARYDDALANGSTFGHPGEKGQAIAVAVLYSLNGLASFTGILTVSLIVYNKGSQWIWQIINATFFGLMAISVGYLGDLLTQIIIILGCPVGWYLFEYGKRVEDEKKGWRYQLVFAAGLAIVVAIAVLILYEFLPGAYGDTFGKIGAKNPYVPNSDLDANGQVIMPAHQAHAMRIMDSMCNGFNITAYVMQVVNIDNQFMLWPLVDILKLVKYTGIAGPKTLSVNMIIEFTVWFSMGALGTWERLFKEPFLILMTKLKK